MEATPVSRRLLKRLPVYLNYLKNLSEDSPNISATAIAKALEVGAVQVRKDLAKVSTGRRKTGRNRHQLIKDIEQYLSLAEQTGTVIVGAGNLEGELLDYPGFAESGLHVVAGFDLLLSNAHSDGGKPVYPLNRLEFFCRHYEVHIGVIAVPAESAQWVCDSLVACGIRTIRNFTPVSLQVPDYITVEGDAFPGEGTQK